MTRWLAALAALALIVWTALAVPRSALGSTVAVLDLDKASGTESYDGLGRALAGMLVSDLAQAPGLSLVERSRLDALLAELDLSSTAFIDPATAQKFHKGLGAEFLVAGSYSVIGDTFLLDARVVGAESGKIVRAVRADGQADAFVDVEKRLVHDLLDGLAIKLAQETVAKIDATVPTRSFDAFTAYGAAVAFQDQGRIDEAREAFAEALRADPGYRAASTALASLDADLDRRRDEVLRASAKARAEMLDKVVARFPVPKSYKDPHAVAGFALRLSALRRQQRYCQRYAEMVQFLDAVNWTFPPPKFDYKKATDEAMALAVDVGFAPAQATDAGSFRDLEFDLQSAELMLFTSISRFVYLFPQSTLEAANAADLMTTMAKCKVAQEVPAEIERLRGMLDAHRLLGAFDAQTPVPLGERLEWTSMLFRARVSGVDAEMASRISALIDLHPDESVNFSLRQQAERIVAEGVGLERTEAQRFGFRDQELASVIEAVAKLDPARVAVDDPDCGPALQVLTWQAKAFASGKTYPGVGATFAPLRDLGCLVGTPARFAAPADAFAWLTEANTRKRPEYADDERCVEGFERLPQEVYPPFNPSAPQDGARAIQVLGWYYLNLQGNLCVTP